MASKLADDGGPASFKRTRVGDGDPAADNVIRVGARAEGDPAVVAKLAASLVDGKAIAVPTDTIYGVACLAQSTAAIRRIYDIKRRDPKKPIAICVADIDDIPKFAELSLPAGLIEELLPGPVTLVLKRTPLLNPDLNPDTKLVGIRIPANAFIRALATAAGGPLALTSANVSAQPSCTQFFFGLLLIIDALLHGVPSRSATVQLSHNSKAGSTVVDLTVSGRYSIIRPGQAAEATIACLEKHGLRSGHAGL